MLPLKRRSRLNVVFENVEYKKFRPQIGTLFWESGGNFLNHKYMSATNVTSKHKESLKKHHV